MLLLVSVTSGGKNSVIKLLLETDKYELIVSDTTRPKRINNGREEQDGVEYNFRTEEDFLADLKKGEYLEAAVIHEQQVSGISVRELQKVISMNKTALTEVDFVGANNINKLKPDAKIVFLAPPSYEEWMERLKKRGQMSQNEFLNRMREAEKTLHNALDQDYMHRVVNDDINKAVREIRDYVEFNQTNPSAIEDAKNKAWHLLNEVKQLLSS